jgi:hypothetical protein
MLLPVVLIRRYSWVFGSVVDDFFHQERYPVRALISTVTKTFGTFEKSEE